MKEERPNGAGAIIPATVTEFTHPARPDPAHSGVLRTIYFLALAAVAFFTVLTAVRGFYDPPDGNAVDFPPGFEDTSGQSDFQQAQDDQRDYNRNVSLIFTAVSAAVFAAAILGFGSRFNPLRAGLILSALVLFLTAMGFWSTASDKWIGFLMTLINFGVLAGCYLFLEEGLPLGPREPPRRLAPADIAPPSTPPPSSAPPSPAPSTPPPSAAPPATDFGPSAPPPPANEPPPARTEPPPPMSDLPRE
jgi:hypothetical protein